MSLGIAIKSAEGIVLAADSRVTILATREIPPGPLAPPVGGKPQQIVFPATYDNATKMLRVRGQDFVGAVTFGAGTIGTAQPRTASSFIPEFEASLPTDARLTVLDFATRLGVFFQSQWQSAGMPAMVGPNENMFFFVGGYDAHEPYGRLYQVVVPAVPAPQEIHAGAFGVQWGGQVEITARLVVGSDPSTLAVMQSVVGQQVMEAHPDLAEQLRNQLQLPIPWEFLPLQDCVDLALLLVRTTIDIQRFLVALRGVGGAVDLATITRMDGFQPVQLKQITVATGSIRGDGTRGQFG